MFKLPFDEAAGALDRWLVGLPLPHPRVRETGQIHPRRSSTLASIEYGLSNGRIESVNTKIRLITRAAFGFNSPEALITLAMLNLGGHKPVLPAGRDPANPPSTSSAPSR